MRSIKKTKLELSRIEEGALVEVARLVGDMIDRVERPSVDMQYVLREIRPQLIVAVQEIRFVLGHALMEMAEQNRIGIARSLRGALANVGVSETDVLNEELDVASYLEWITTSMMLIGERIESEMERQGVLAQSFDDPVEEGWATRLFSLDPVRRPGRSGRGVLMSLVSASSSILALVGYRMVNAHRLEVWRRVDVG